MAVALAPPPSRASYTRFTYLWTTDLPAMFAEFLQLAEQEVAGDSEDGCVLREPLLVVRLLTARARQRCTAAQGDPAA